MPVDTQWSLPQLFMSPREVREAREVKARRVLLLLTALLLLPLKLTTRLRKLRGRLSNVRWKTPAYSDSMRLLPWQLRIRSRKLKYLTMYQTMYQTPY